MKRLIILVALVASLQTLQAKKALVVIAHGSPMPQWRQPVLDLEPMLQSRKAELKAYDYVRVAMMEFTEPTVATVVSDCEKAGVDTIFAVPLFIAPSGHSEVDIPNIIGQKYNPQVVSELKEENTTLVRTRLPIILGPTLSYDDFLEKTMVERVKEISTSPTDEALLFICHGDRDYIGIWNKKMKQIEEAVGAQTGISTIDHRYVAMGYKMVREMIPVMKEMAATKKRILVQGVYLTSSAKELADGIGMDEQTSATLPAGTEVVYNDMSILPAASTSVCDWIIKRANEFDNNFR